MAGSNTALSISLRGVTKRFGERRILQDVTLEVRPGETVALVGPSGAGKSTLLRCINALHPFDDGEIRVGPHALTPQSSRSNGSAGREVRRLVGMVFQDFQLFPHLSAIENVTEAPRRVLRQTREAATAQAQALLRRVGMTHREHAYPEQLSGGEKQRVAIARALAMGPRGLLCDEITSALDPELKHEVLAVLEDLKRDGLTLLLVTHELGFARRAADRVVVLADGVIVEVGPSEQVLEHPQNPRTRQFLSRVMG